MTILAATAQTASLPDFDAYGVNDKAYDFSAAQWPAATFVMPASGQAIVTIGADCFTEYADPEAYFEVLWRIPTGLTPLTPGRGWAGSGIKVHGCRRVLVQGTPGTSYTIVPQYRVARASNEQTRIRYGQLIIES